MARVIQFFETRRGGLVYRRTIEVAEIAIYERKDDMSGRKIQNTIPVHRSFKKLANDVGHAVEELSGPGQEQYKCFFGGELI